MYEAHKQPVISTRRFMRRQIRHALVALALILVSLVIGMAGYMGLAKMSVVDAFLNTAMLLGGMGPVGDLKSDAAKIFAGLFALYAGVIFIVAAGILVAPGAHRILHRLHAEETESEHRRRPR